MAGFIHDMALMENLLMESKLCYTVLRPPILTNGELSRYLEHADVNVESFPCNVEAGASWLVHSGPGSSPGRPESLCCVLGQDTLL